MGQEARGLIVVVALAALLQFMDLGGPALWDRDEPRNAQCAREMLERGDWVVPFFNGELRDHKPVLVYWLMMVSYSLFGVNEFAARAPSALLGTLTVATVYYMGRRLWGKDAAFWSGLCFATCLLFTLVARAATPDASLIFCSTMALALFVAYSDDFRVQLQRDSAGISSRAPFPQKWWQATMIYAVMGLGVLAKGPVGLVLPTAVIGMYCLLRRLNSPQRDSRERSTGTQAIAALGRSLVCAFHPAHFLRTCWSMRPITALATVLAVAGPWYAWVGVRTDGAWLAGFFGTHNLGRAMASMEGHQGGLWFYPLVLLVGTFPWSIFTVPAVLYAWHRWRSSGETDSSTAGLVEATQNRGLLLICCWVMVYVVLFTLAATKLPNYVAPVYPAMALLFGWTLERRMRGQAFFGDVWIDVGFGVKLVVGLAVVVAVFVAMNENLPELRALCAIGLIPMAFALLGWVAWRNQRFATAVRLVALSAAGLTAALLIFAAGQVSMLNRCDEFFSPCAGTITQDERLPIASMGNVEPSWVFYAGRPIQEFRVDDFEGLVAFIERHPHAVVLTRSRPKDTTLAHLNKPSDRVVTPAGDVACFLKDEHLFAFTTSQISLARKRTNANYDH